MTVDAGARRWGTLPTAVLAIDLERGLPDVTGLGGYAVALVLVRLADEPVGTVRVPVEGDRCTGVALADAIVAELLDPLLRVVLLRGLEGVAPGAGLELDVVTLDAAPAEAPTGADMTVAVCTRDRPERLRRCLDALRVQRTTARILVVDNAPSSDETARLVGAEFPGVTYVVEPRPGLDHARNRALAVSSTELLAFTDDDAVPDDRWTAALGRAFAEEPDLAMVTGLVVPLALDTPAQHVFERLGGFGRGTARRWVDADPSAAGRHLGTGQLGTGANMAFRRSALLAVGGFDPALDVGTPTGGGGDHDVFHRVIAAGLLVRYEPAAIVFHEHRRTMTELREQVRGNGAVWSMMAAARTAGRAERGDVARVVRWYATHDWPQRLLRAWLVPNRVPVALPATEIRGFAAAALRRTYRRSQALNGTTAAPASPPAGPSAAGSPTAVTSAEVTGAPPSGLGEVATMVVLTRDRRAVGRVVVPARRHPLSARAWREVVVDELGVGVLASCDERPAAEVRADALARLRSAVRARVAPPAPPPAPCSATIVIASLNRPDDLASCLRHVVDHRSTHPFDVVVVDNDPASGLTAPVCDRFPGVTLVAEPRRGLAHARNAGIRRATGDVVVTTDDDVRVADGWLDLLLEPFRRNDVRAVCGNVQPLELGNRAQADFESISPLGKGFAPFESRWGHPTRPWTAFPAWELGATANAAFRRDVFDDPEVGLMDVALGPGTPSGVGEDSYLLYRIVRAGYTVVYEPTAFVWHRHRDTDAALATQISNYYSGHVAHQLTTLVRDHDPRAVHRLARVGAYAAVSRLQAVVGRGPVPPAIARAQLRGTLRGPAGYLRAQRRARAEAHADQSAGPP